MIRQFALLLTLAVAAGITTQSRAQSLENLRWSPEGVVVFLGDRAIGPGIEGPVQGFVIHRAASKDGPFSEVGRAVCVSGPREFRAMAGDAVVDALRAMKQQRSDDDLLALLRARPSLDEYGLLAVDVNFLRAVGAAWRDESAEAKTRGRSFWYKLLAIRNGAVESDGPVGKIETGKPASLPVFRAAAAPVERDSAVSFVWAVPSALAGETQRAVMYTEIDGGDFRPRPLEFLGSRVNDTLFFRMRVPAAPGSRVRAFLQPLDLVGNAGPSSDTLLGFTVDWLRLPVVQGLSARDSSAGILLTWTPLPAGGHITGIVLERSVKPSIEFEVIDTLGRDAVAFVDGAVVPGATYYYRLGVLTTRGVKHAGGTQASASHMSVLPPLAPTGLAAATEGRHIRLRWDAVPEGDLFAYFVYRANGPGDSLVQVSPALKEATYLDTAASLDGRFTYTYCVRAVNTSQLESEPSANTFARPARPKAPPAPLGISAMPMGSRVRLTWTDMTRVDPLIKHYRLYRRQRALPVPKQKSATPAVEVDTAFVLLKISEVPPTDDSNVVAGRAYQYAVSTVNAEGIEGPRSRPSSIKMPWPPVPAPEGLSTRSTERGILLRWNPVEHPTHTGFAIYRRGPSDDEPQWIASISKADIEYLDTYTARGGRYFYSVAAIAAGGEGARCLEKAGRR